MTEPAHQEDKIIATVYIAKNRALFCMQQTLTESKGEIALHKNRKLHVPTFNKR
jgi:hypothetical protein